MHPESAFPMVDSFVDVKRSHEIAKSESRATVSVRNVLLMKSKPSPDGKSRFHACIECRRASSCDPRFLVGAPPKIARHPVCTEGHRGAQFGVNFRVNEVGKFIARFRARRRIANSFVTQFRFFFPSRFLIRHNYVDCGGELPSRYYTAGVN